MSTNYKDWKNQRAEGGSSQIQRWMKVTSKNKGERNRRDVMTWPLGKQKIEMAWREKSGRDLMDGV